jgi:ATP/maltotriose-dependent transcriptional regulator MalT
LIWTGDPCCAEAELRPGYDALRRLGWKSHFSSLAHALANAVCAQGRYEEAERPTYECEDASSPNHVYSQILWRSTRVKVFVHRGQFEPAEQVAREAVEFAAASDFHPAHAEALIDLAEVLTLAGDADAAATAVAEAIRFYELKGQHAGRRSSPVPAPSARVVRCVKTSGVVRSDMDRVERA